LFVGEDQNFILASFAEKRGRILVSKQLSGLSLGRVCSCARTQEDSKATREKATDYIKIHGTVLAAELNEWYATSLGPHAGHIRWAFMPLRGGLHRCTAAPPLG